MLRHPPLQVASALFTRGGASLPPRIALLRPPRSVTETPAPAPPAPGDDPGAGPRADLPLTEHAPAPRAALPDGLVDRCLARMDRTAQRAGAVDDHDARRDPETRPFAAVPAGRAPDGADATTAARVAGPGDRPATAELPVIDLD